MEHRGQVKDVRRARQPQQHAVRRDLISPEPVRRNLISPEPFRLDPTGAEAAATGAAATGHFIYDLEAVRLAAARAAAAATGAAATRPFISPEPIRLFPPSRRNLISLNQFMSPEPVRARPEPID